ncbi:HNH endonuclease [Methylocystis sp. H4A]|uniref:HNH endonuclease n=1 Tax=Methylocystis sp. H4A TaxID=2785788 RepID=UPI0018C3038F|nr:HNH endonuclease signature motif containing protein [Methylocystis sp. H4A]MBG0802815.1 HNH endonuclease [Methylocystis sp. H4A]
MQPVQSAVAAACADFDAAAPDVHNLRPINIAKATCDALIDGYDNRTVAIKRLLADMVASLPPEDADLCPYCSLDTNPDLDHFLPKKRFPEFALYGRNLVPICTPCNRKKSGAVKTKVDGHRLFLNPSFEPTNNSCVLEAELTFKGDNLLVRYLIDDGGRLPDGERALAQRHYNRLNLGTRYSRRAHSFLASFKASVTGKPEAVIARTLKRQIETASIGEPANGWRPALYRAIASKEAPTLRWLLTPKP